MTDRRDELARVIHADHCCPCDPNGCDQPDGFDYRNADAVLTWLDRQEDTLRARVEELAESWQADYERSDYTDVLPLGIAASNLNNLLTTLDEHPQPDLDRDPELPTEDGSELERPSIEDVLTDHDPLCSHDGWWVCGGCEWEDPDRALSLSGLGAHRAHLAAVIRESQAV